MTQVADDFEGSIQPMSSCIKSSAEVSNWLLIMTLVGSMWLQNFTFRTWLLQGCVSLIQHQSFNANISLCAPYGHGHCNDILSSIAIDMITPCILLKVKLNANDAFIGMCWMWSDSPFFSCRAGHISIAGCDCCSLCLLAPTMWPRTKKAQA